MVDSRNADEFYASKEWAALKKRVYNRYGRRCMATGLTEKDGITLSVDKIYPRSKYPGLALKMSNMQVMMLQINQVKGDRIIKDFRPFRWKLYYWIIDKTKLVLLALLIVAGLWYWRPQVVALSSQTLPALAEALSPYLDGFLPL